MTEDSIFKTWAANHPSRKYTGSSLFGVSYCILREKPVRPQEGDALVSAEKWEIEIFIGTEWRTFDLNVLGGMPPW